MGKVSLGKVSPYYVKCHHIGNITIIGKVSPYVFYIGKVSS